MNLKQWPSACTESCNKLKIANAAAPAFQICSRLSRGFWQSDNICTSGFAVQLLDTPRIRLCYVCTSTMLRCDLKRANGSSLSFDYCTGSWGSAICEGQYVYPRLRSFTFLTLSAHSRPFKPPSTPHSTPHSTHNRHPFSTPSAPF